MARHGPVGRRRKIRFYSPSKLRYADVRWACLLAVSSGMFLAAPACHAPTAPPPPQNEATLSSEPEAVSVEAEPVEPPPEPIIIPAEFQEIDRWLFVEKARDRASGAWATGSFGPKRNKLTIRTRGVQQFAIDTSRTPINWERLVVIGIDGANSELRKRDYPILHFARDDHGRWVVLEP